MMGRVEVTSGFKITNCDLESRPGAEPEVPALRLDKKLAAHDKAIAAILSAIRELMRLAAPKHRGIGFTTDIRAKR